MKDCINVGLIGLGTVGGGVARILLENEKNLCARAGVPIRLAKINTLVLKNPLPFPLADGILTDDISDLLDNPEIDVIVECIGGVGAALVFARRALGGGKHFVTSNKELIAKFGPELIALASANNVNLCYEASVCGGIPIIHGLKNNLAADNIRKLFGILNGTTNYILDKMTQDGAEFADALADAQRLGFAEADPTNDVDGFDVAYKLSILAGIAFNTSFRFEDIHFEGIRAVGAYDIAFAERLGYVIKLIATGVDHGESGVELRVHPVMVPVEHPLASVGGAFNGVFVEGDYIGQAMFYGPGAGSMPTACAVVGDVVDIAMTHDLGHPHPSMTTNFGPRKVMPMGDVESEYFLRLSVKDQPGVLAKIAAICGDLGVSLKNVEQPESEGGLAELILITHPVREKSMQEALGLMRNLSVVIKVESLIRVGLA
ncbi:MAG: homoserine dehydrogenase [Opitutales bacterium]|jgi:homoserine dehydrogenase